MRQQNIIMIIKQILQIISVSFCDKIWDKTNFELYKTFVLQIQGPPCLTVQSNLATYAGAPVGMWTWGLVLTKFWQPP